MELLKRLGLEPTPAVHERMAARAADDSARRAALAVQAELTARLREASAQARQLAGGQAALDKLVAASRGAQRPPLEAKKKLLDERVRLLDRELAGMHADLEALGNPGTKREEYVAILARARSTAAVRARVETDTDDEVIGKGPLDARKTTTKSSYQDGRAVVSTQDQTRTVGWGGIERTSSSSIDEISADGRSKRVSETSTKVSMAKVSIDDRRSTEIERGDKKWSREQKNSTAIDGKGVIRQSTDTVTGSDGTSSATTTARSLDRGDGKLGVGVGRTTTRSDAAGNESGRGASGKAGLGAGDGSMGGYGEGKGQVSRQGPGGFKGGAGLGLSASASCTIGEPAEGLYPVTVRVMVGASVDASVGHGKKEATKSASLELSASKAFVFERTHQLDARALAGYVKALQAADKGGKVAATYVELRLLSIGVAQGWDEARRFLSGKESLGDAVGQRAGDSASVSEKSSRGGKFAADLEALKFGVGGSQADSHSTKATRTGKGDLSVESSVGHESERTGSVGVGMGAVSGSIARSHTLKTSIGYTITIEAAADPEGRLLREFQACDTPALQERFIARHKGRIQVTGKKTTRTQSQGEEVEIKAGIGLGVGNRRGIDESVEADDQGRLRRSRVAGSNRTEGHVALGSVRIGGSESTGATSIREGDGASLDVTDMHAETNLGKLFNHLIGRDDDDAGKKKKGLIATAAGKEKNEDEEAAATEDRDLARIGVSRSDLKLVIEIARGDPGRWSHCAGRLQDYKDWVATGRRIAASGNPGEAADLLAKFVGGGSASRREVIENLIRPAGNVRMATRSEFPQSLKKQRAPYDELVGQPCEERIAETAAKDGTAAAGTLGQELIERLGRLLDAVTRCPDFMSKATQAEMISAINERKTRVLAAMRRNAKATPAADAQADKDEFGRLLRECGAYQNNEAEVKGRIYALLGDRTTVVLGDIKESQRLFRDLRNLHAIWQRDYAKMDELGRRIGRPATAYAAFQPHLGDMDKLWNACWRPAR